MKKALSYALTAILLGTMTMLVPPLLFEPSYDGWQAFGRTEALTCVSRESEGILDSQGALGRAICPSNLSSTGFMLIPSFLLALGFFLYFKKRMF